MIQSDNHKPARNVISAGFAVLCLLAVTACGSSGLDHYRKDFAELDKAMDSFETVIAAENALIASRTAELSTLQDRDAAAATCLSLIRSYERLSIDSLSKYTSIYSSLARTADEKAMAAIEMSIVAQCKEDFISCVHLCRDIDTTKLSADLRKIYLQHWESVNYSMFVRAFNAKDSIYLNRSAGYYRDELRKCRAEYLRCDSTSVNSILVRVSELRDDKFYAEALEYLKSNEYRFVSDNERSQYSRYQAVLYDFLEDESNRLYALIQSEIYCFRRPTYDHLSLISIAKVLSARGDLERAAKYISLAEEYSLRYKHMARMANAGKASRRILDQVNEVRKQNQRRLYIAFGVLSLVAITLVLLLLFTLKIQRKLSVANTRLRESEIIKDNYLFKYMVLAVEYLHKADEYHKNLRKLAKNDKETLFAQLRLPSQFEADRKEFYKTYDRNFLLLFPNFLSSVNSMMKEGCKYELGSNGTMPVELRVLSVIRLGMTDSQQISAFLNYSLSTVYTYRSRAAEKSLYSREEFEKRLVSSII